MAAKLLSNSSQTFSLPLIKNDWDHRADQLKECNNAESFSPSEALALVGIKLCLLKVSSAVSSHILAEPLDSVM